MVNRTTNRLLQFLEKQDQDLKIKELIQIIESEQEKLHEKESNQIEEYRNKYKGCYLKEIDNDSIFGKTLNVYYIMRLEGTGKTESYETFYHISGNRLRISPGDINFRGLNPTSASDSFTEKQLDSMEIITREEYEEYVREYYDISKKLKSLIEGNEGSDQLLCKKCNTPFEYDWHVEYDNCPKCGCDVVK